MGHAGGAATLLLAVFLASCAGDTAGFPDPLRTEPITPPSISEPSPTTPTTSEQVPEPATTEQGGRFWGVYLAAGEGPELEDAIQYLREERGLRASEFNAGSDIACDGGARKALGGGAGPLVVAVYFLSEADAQAWAATLPAAPLAIARVRTFCLD